MKEKLLSRKFWIAILTNLISIIAVFTDLGGTTGTIFGIIGTILSSISYIIVEGMVDVERAKVDYEEVKRLIQLLKKEGE